MSYYSTPESFYRFQEPGTPFWQHAPVPGWGVNPLLAGPARVGIGEADAATKAARVAFVVGGGLVLTVGAGAGALIGGKGKRALGAVIGGAVAIIPAFFIGATVSAISASAAS